MKKQILKVSTVLGIVAIFFVAFLSPFYKAEAQTTLPTVGITASPDTICVGQSTHIYWSSTNAPTVQINQGIGYVNPSGDRFLQPSQTTTYTITGTDSNGVVSTASVTVTVNNGGSCGPTTPPTTPLPTVNISANPSSVSYNGASTISWSSNNATSCTASSGTNGWSGAKSTSGTFNTGSLANTTTYTITCSNSAGSATDSTAVTVGSQPQNNPTVNITANPSSLSNGGTSTVSWSSSNATSCNASNGTNGWSGLKANSGSFYTGALYNTTTYTIICSNSTGSASDSVTVYVDQINNQYLSVNTNSATNVTTNGALLNGYVTGVNNSSVTTWFQWGTSYSNLFNTTNQNYNYGNNNFSSNIFNLSPNTTYYFRAVAQGNSGTVYGNVLSFTTTGGFINPIYPTPVYNQPSVNITADLNNLGYGSATTLRWTSFNANSCYASGGSLGWAGAKSTGPASFYTGSLTASRTYTITCTNGYGTATDSVTVNIGSQTTTTTTTPVRSNNSSLLVVTTSVDRNQPIIPTLDNTMPRPGDEITYTVNYRNIGNASLTGLNLQLQLPVEVDYLYSTPANPSRFGQLLTFNLGTLRANQEGQVTVRVKVRENVQPGSILNFPANLTYTDANGQFQSVQANVTAEVFRDGESLGFLAGNVFGAGFLPGTLFGWLLLIILILLLILAAKNLFPARDNRYVLAPVPHDPHNSHGTTHTTSTHH